MGSFVSSANLNFGALCALDPFGRNHRMIVVRISEINPKSRPFRFRGLRAKYFSCFRGLNFFVSKRSALRIKVCTHQAPECDWLSVGDCCGCYYLVATRLARARTL